MAHMRLAKREITDGKELRSVIEKCTVLRIGGRDEEGMFIVPVNYGYEWEEKDGDISLKDVKRRTGNTMTVFGNIQLKLLEHGSEEEVKQAVITCMEEAKAGGRYVLMPTASPINIPLSPKTMKNYQVMISTAREYGVY